MFCFGGNERGTGAVRWKGNNLEKMVALHGKEVEWLIRSVEAKANS